MLARTQRVVKGEGRPLVGALHIGPSSFLVAARGQEGEDRSPGVQKTCMMSQEKRFRAFCPSPLLAVAGLAAPGLAAADVAAAGAAAAGAAAAGAAAAGAAAGAAAAGAAAGAAVGAAAAGAAAGAAATGALVRGLSGRPLVLVGQRLLLPGI
jgi:hypothetical protein